MYDHGSFSKLKLLSEISRKPEHVTISIGYVKNFMIELTCRHRDDGCISTVPNAEGSKSVADIFET